MNALMAFHFLRPWWLLLLLPMAPTLWWIWRQGDPAAHLRSVIRPELLEHLVINKDSEPQRLKPIYLLTAAWFVAAVALAGPAWQKESTPFAEDRSALMIVMKVTPSMEARDVQPSRLERSAHKLGELLALRSGTRTGLVAYAGSTHLVMPLTDDSEIIRYFAAELDPTVMPQTGDDPVSAVKLAARRLSESGLAGSVLLVADAIDASAREGLQRVHRESGWDIHVYGMAAGPDVVPLPGGPPAPFLDEESMRQAARAGGGRFVAVRPDDGDLRSLDSNLTRSITTANAQQGERWKDAGYYLAWLVAALALLFWRRGGAVRLEDSK